MQETSVPSIAATATIRAQFPALERVHNGRPVAYFDGPGGTQVPLRVTEAVTDYLLHHNANTHWRYPTSEETDAIVIVVSEETSQISIAHRGRLERNVSPDRVRDALGGAAEAPRIEDSRVMMPRTHPPVRSACQKPRAGPSPICRRALYWLSWHAMASRHAQAPSASQRVAASISATA